MSRSIKVAHVTTVDLSLRYLLLNQLQAISARGYEVYGLSAPGTTVKELEAGGVRFVPIPFVRATNLKPAQDLRAFVELVRVLRRERFTIVHTHTAKPDLYATWAARMAGVPIVITTLHGFLAHDLTPPFWRRLYMNLAKLGMMAADRVLSQNEEDVATAVREHICPATKIKVLGNGIDVRRFAPVNVKAEVKARVREELGIPPEAKVIGFVGRMVREKGVLELLEAAKRVRARYPSARFLFVGMIDRAKQDVVTPELADALEVSDVCIFAGHRDDLPEVYALMDVFVLPSHREGFPRTPMEASAMGVPCVVTDVRGCRTVVRNGENGLLTPMGDAEALGQAILELLDNPTRAREMGTRAREMALERFDERRVFETVLDEYTYWLAKKGIGETWKPIPA